ncbi:hypothetical protein [Thermogymnomonas acidicola]|uniref:hypothetical protein n=1 Tax=Thermogymnomonas acidicola TaxID=399579 RepID=UPI00094617CE|nr:hypothetical protein [Thermogymnomonas acidicola]
MLLPPYLLDLSVTFAFLAWGSASDVRRRAVNSFLFLPVAIAGLAYGAYVHEPLFFLVLSGISFILAFVRTDILLYPALAASMLGVSTYFVTIEPPTACSSSSSPLCCSPGTGKWSSA